jgi:hypothetical protein
MGRSREGDQERLWQAQRMKLMKQVRYLWQGRRVHFVTPIGEGMGTVQQVTAYGDVMIECECCCGEVPLVMAFDVACADEFLSLAEER